MNRLTKKIAMLALAFLVLGAVSVQAREKQPKKKKHVDLSANPLAGVNSKQPDKELYDKAMIAMKKGRFDVARLDLQTMLNTYPESEYRMRAKLAVGDSWFKEGGAAAMTQAEAAAGGWRNTGRPKVASVTKTSQGTGSKALQVGSRRRL